MRAKNELQDCLSKVLAKVERHIEEIRGHSKGVDADLPEVEVKRAIDLAEEFEADADWLALVLERCAKYCKAQKRS